ncbi:MAG: alpha/beta hydrolase [Dysgonamonadaceae bacterium]|jgi:acetyl esterase/lipase|nr:alpha/beta hydrolase [Dysgonamonadaceae bacterium]
MKNILFIACICLLAYPSNGQEVIDLYEEGKIPDVVTESIDDKKNVPNVTVFLPENPTGEAIVICPGGGYTYLAVDHEGYDIAKRFNENGIAAFVLKYRLPNIKISTKPHLAPIQDLQTAIDIVRCRAEEWKIDPNKVGVIGFSAGGHLASTGGTHFDRQYITSKSGNLRPDFMILIYPVISSDLIFTHTGSIKNLLGNNFSDELLKEFSNEKQVTKDTPPAFLVHSADDAVVPVKNSIVFAEELAKNNILFEMHIFPKGGHGYGMNNPTTKTDWFNLCLNWLK